MIDDEPASERDPIDLLAEQFLGRYRAGESVEVEAFAAEHPAHAERLRDLLPTLLALEQVKRDRESTSAGGARMSLPEMDRLGDFRIVREVGRGGMGVVFEAVQESLSRRVALKVLPQASLLTGNQLMRFQREAQFAARLHHSNIVPVFGSGQSDGFHWYAMQFIAGEGLDAWRAAQDERLPVASGEWRSRARFVASVGEQVASALHYAHEQGTLHRDVKPANLLLDEAGHVWVTDFGLAKALESEGLTQSGDVLGTLQYMAPEQFAGRYDARSEVYALGVTLHELLTLRPAYAGRTRSELMEAIRRGRPPSLRRQCPDVPDDLVVVIEKATATDPADRYESAEALQHDLQAFLEDRPIAARRQRLGALVIGWCRRNRLLASVAAAALFALLVAGVTGWVAYVVTEAASQRAESNLRLSLAAFGDVFDAIVGPDPLLLFDEDPDTGEQSVMTLRAVDRHDVELLEKVLLFYGEFAAQNAESQALRFETARAHRRIGVIHARLGAWDEAAAAYDEALRLYAEVGDRDLTREIAAVHVDYGRLELLQGRRDESTLRFEKALEILEEGGTEATSLAQRFDRADVHHLLARNGMLPARPPEGAAGDGGRPGGRPRDRTLSSIAAAQRHLRTALELVGSVLAEDGDNVEARALKARCLLTPSFVRGRDAPTAGEDRTAGLQLLRELAAESGGSRFRLELCQALSDARGRRRPGPSTERTAELLEAREHADKLLEELPQEPEHREMRARVGAELARQWLSAARTADEPQRSAMSQEAEAELRATRQYQLECFAAGEADGQLVFSSLRSNGELDGLLRRSGRVPEADELLAGYVAALRPCLEAMKDRTREPGAWRGWPWNRRERMGRPGSFGLGAEFQRELGKLEDEGLLQVLRDRRGPGERRDGRPPDGPRPDGPPPEPRRGGR